MAARKGIFKPKHPEKYQGDSKKIFYRSSWELIFFQYCDRNDSIIEWASEEFCIPYISPLDGRIHRYFPDVKIQVKDAKTGATKTLVIEIKPAKENAMDPSKQPQRGNKRTRTYMIELAKWGVNDAKFKAATEYCLDRGWIFKVMTEHDLGLLPK